MSAARAKHAAKTLLGAIAALLLVVVVLGALALTTEIGAELVVRAGLGRIGAGAEVGSVSGTLRGPLVLRDVVVRPGSATVRIERLVADWKPLELLDGFAAFERVLVDGVDIVVPAGDTAASSSAPGLARPIDLPVGVSVGQLTIRRLSVSAPGLDVTGGEVHAAGRAAGYRFDAAGDVSSGALSDVALALSGTGNLERVEIDSLSARLLDGRLTGSGTVAWQPRVAWSLAVDGSRLDPAGLTADSARWRGELSLQGRTAGVLTADGARGTVRLDTIAGTLRGEPVSGAGHIELQAGGYQVPSLALTWGGARLAASGSLTNQLDFTYSLNAPSLGELLPDAAGSLESEGTLGGTLSAPIVDAEIDASNLRFRDVRLARAVGDVELNLANGGSNRVDLLLRDLRMDGLRLERAAVTGSGARGSHQVRANVRGDDWRGTLRLDGGFAAESWRWEGMLDSLRIQHPQAGTWRLRAPGQLVVTTASVELARSCIGSGAALICARGGWQESSGWRAAGRAEELPVGRASSLLPPGWSISGRAAAEFSGALASDGAVRAEAELDPGPVRVRGPDLPYAYMSLDSALVQLEIDSQGTRARFRGRVLSPEEERLGRLEGTVLLPGFSRTGMSLPQQPIDGRIDARFEDIAVFASFVPDVDSLQGRLNAEVDLQGTVHDPQFAGSLRLSDGAARIRSAGITLRDVTLSATGAVDSTVRIEGRLRSGDGWLRLDGAAVLAGGPRPIRLDLTGERFEAINTPRVRAVVSPSLEMTVTRDSVRVEGELALPFLSIVSQQRDGPSDSIVYPLDDVILVDATPVTSDRRPSVAGRVRIVLGDSVRIAGRRLTTQLGGSILLSAAGDPPIEATGELIVHEGTFELRSGRLLAIEHGRVALGGSPIADPGLLIQTTATEEPGVLTGVVIDGEIRVPQVALVQTPRLLDLDVLAYLVLGQRLAAPYEGDEGTLTGEFEASLGLEGGHSSTALVQRGLAWDRENPEPRVALMNPSFAAGEYLGPHLQATYETGTFGPESILELRYFLSRTLMLNGEEGRDTRGDVFYHLE